MDSITEFEQSMLQKGFSEKTVESYAGDVRLFQGFLQTTIGESSLTRKAFSIYKRYLVDHRYVVSTINKKVNSLQAYNLFLLETGRATELVVSLKRDRIKVASGSEGDVEVFTEEETARILNHVSDERRGSLRNRLIVHLSINKGCALANFAIYG